MYFDSVQALWHMDGHGFYVWTALCMTLLVICWIIVTPVRKRRRVVRELRAELRRAGASTSGSQEVS